MQGSKVSIIIPVYKTEKFLRKCLDSVVNQTLQDIEIIIVDEGDMDECRAIIDEYERNDSRIKTIHEKNGGYGVSINKGFDLATGEYIGIVESDDFVDENMFEDLYKIAKDSDADIVKSDWIEYTESKNLCRQVGKINKTMTGKDLTAKTYPRLLSIQPSIWSAIYKKSFLNDNNIRFLSTPGGSYQDTSFTFKVMTLAPKIRLTSKAYLYYRQDNENSSVKNTGKVYAICDEYEEITRFLDEHKDIKEWANTQKLIRQYRIYIWNLRRIDEKYREEFIEEFAETFKKYYENNEIGKDFFKKINKKEFNMLLNDKAGFKKHVDKLVQKAKSKAERRKMFSVNINLSRISIVLFGKHIVEIS